MTRRIAHDQCFGAIIDVQDFFLDQVDKGLRAKLKTRIKQFARLLGHFRMPIVVTLERSIDRKGRLPKEIKKHLGDAAEIFEKDFFDLTKEDDIAAHIRTAEEEAGTSWRAARPMSASCNPALACSISATRSS